MRLHWFSKNLQALPKIYVATMQKIAKKRNTLKLDSKVQGLKIIFLVASFSIFGDLLELSVTFSEY
jgi:hypothetical protein